MTFKVADLDDALDRVRGRGPSPGKRRRLRSRVEGGVLACRRKRTAPSCSSREWWASRRPRRAARARRDERTEHAPALVGRPHARRRAAGTPASRRAAHTGARRRGCLLREPAPRRRRTRSRRIASTSCGRAARASASSTGPTHPPVSIAWRSKASRPRSPWWEPASCRSSRSRARTRARGDLALVVLARAACSTRSPADSHAATSSSSRNSVTIIGTGLPMNSSSTTSPSPSSAANSTRPPGRSTRRNSRQREHQIGSRQVDHRVEGDHASGQLRRDGQLAHVGHERIAETASTRAPPSRD